MYTAWKNNDIAGLNDNLVLAIAAISAGALVPVARVLTSSLEAASSNVAAGANSVSFVTSVDFVGSINGIARDASMGYSFQAEVNNTLPQINFIITTGTILIDKLV